MFASSLYLRLLYIERLPNLDISNFYDYNQQGRGVSLGQIELRSSIVLFTPLLHPSLSGSRRRRRRLLRRVRKLRLRDPTPSLPFRHNSYQPLSLISFISFGVLNLKRVFTIIFTNSFIIIWFYNCKQFNKSTVS